MADPLVLFRERLEAAASAQVVMPEAVALATSDASGRPSVRMVILRGVDARGFVFYTNENSRKGRELRARPQAALCFWWPQTEEQVRVEGRVVLLPSVEADAYFAGRPRGSQVGAWASRQSEVLGSLQEMLQAAAEVERQYAGGEVPRPPFWLGYLLIPSVVEFWHGESDRLHHRVRFDRDGTNWRETLLYP